MLFNTFQSLLQECVRGTLREKTILLVTHQVDFLHNVDLILVCPMLIYSPPFLGCTCVYVDSGIIDLTS